MYAVHLKEYTKQNRTIALVDTVSKDSVMKSNMYTYVYLKDGFLM